MVTCHAHTKLFPALWNPPRTALAWVDSFYEARYASATLPQSRGLYTDVSVAIVKLQDPNANIHPGGNGTTEPAYSDNTVYNVMKVGAGDLNSFQGHSLLKDAYYNYRVLRVKATFEFHRNRIDNSAGVRSFRVFACPTPWAANTTYDSDSNPYPNSYLEYITNPSAASAVVDFGNESHASLYLDINMTKLFGDNVVKGDEYEQKFDQDTGDETGGANKGAIMFGFVPNWCANANQTYAPPSIRIKLQYLLHLSHPRQRQQSGLPA